MKKLYLLISTLIIFIGCFICVGLDSFALVTVEPLTEGFHSGTLKWAAPNGSSLVEYQISENSQYNRLGLCCYFQNIYNSTYQTELWYFIDVLDLLNGTTSSEPFAYVVRNSYTLPDLVLSNTSNQTWYTEGFSDGVPLQNVNPTNGYFYIDFPVFSSKEDAINYYRYGLIDEDSIRYGEDYLADTHFDSIEYNPLSVPAPNVEWVADANGKFTHQLHFLNNGYFGEHNTQLYYGLILSMHWFSCEEASLSIYQNQGVYTRYEFLTSSFCMSDEVKIYPSPTTPFNFNDYKCPPYLDLDTNGLSINGFNQMLSAYPINNRTFNVTSNQSNANFVLNSIKNQLDDINYKLNCPIVSCQYFVVDENNKLIKGPITKIRIKYPNPCYYNDTGAELGYDQSEVQNYNPETDTPLNNPTVINPPSAPNPGPESPIQIPDYSSVNAQDLVDNMGSIFSLVGQVPSFIAQLFSFLPEWLIVFIAVSIGLVVAIGVVKLFLG